MNYTTRTQENRLFQAFTSPMITGILGPRRVGKSTLIEHYCAQHPTITHVQFNMDKMLERERIQAGFLEDMILTAVQRHFVPNHRIWVTIDEAQKCPELFEQVKLLYDRYKDQDVIKFILTGSALLELHRLSAESLAGRINLYYLSSFNLKETVHLKHNITLPSTCFDLIQSNEFNEEQWHAYYHSIRPYTSCLKESLNELLIWGGLPEVLVMPNDLERLDYLGNYLQTYLEKDVRAIESITDLPLYRHLMDIIAEQSGSVRDDTRMLQALGCHRDTLSKYRGYLAATLMYQDISPYINSTLKRLVKSPKGYLINNGLISYLSGLHDLTVLTQTGQIGHRLETWFLNELQVWMQQTPGRQSIHYWRTSAGAEVDFVVKKPPYVLPFEVTFSSHIEPKKVNNLLRFLAYEPKATRGYYIYMGDFQWDAVKRIAFIPAWSVCL
jgi:uncharacterized protein